MNPLAICSRSDLLTSWRRAFPNGRVAGVPPEAGELPPAVDQIWIHGENAAAADVGALVERVAERFPSLPLVVMSTAPDQAAALRALDRGARGYCHALAAPEMLRQVATVVAHGGLWIGPELMKRMLGSASTALAAAGTDAPELGCLSPRERAVACEVGKGATNREVALALGITERTVKAHLASVFEKLGVRDRLELVLVLRDARFAISPDVA